MFSIYSAGTQLHIDYPGWSVLCGTSFSPFW